MKHLGLLTSLSRRKPLRSHPRLARCPFASRAAPNASSSGRPLDFSLFEPILPDSNSESNLKTNSQAKLRPNDFADSITRLISDGEYDEACHLVRTKLSSGYIPTRPGFLLALQAVCIAGQWQQNLPLLQSVREKAVYTIESSLWSLPDILKLAEAAMASTQPNAAFEELSALIKDILHSKEFPMVSETGTNVLDVALRTSAHKFGPNVNVAVRLLDIILSHIDSSTESLSVNSVLPSLTLQLVVRKCLHQRRMDLVEHAVARIESYPHYLKANLLTLLHFDVHP